MRNQTRELTIAIHGEPAGKTSRHRVLEAMTRDGSILHELDYEDLALSAQGLRLVRRAAM